MRRNTSIGITAAVCIAAVAASGMKLFAEDPKPAMAMDEAAMMKAWMDYATPAAEHAELAKMAGDWTAEVEMTEPGKPTEKSAGTSKMTAIFGGRYLQEEFHGSMMGQDFEGMSITGFDNKTKEYNTVWLDSMGTGIMMSKGKAVGGKQELSGEMTCPFMDKPAKSKMVLTPMGNDKYTMDMTTTAADGTPMGTMKITYTRKK